MANTIVTHDELINMGFIHSPGIILNNYELGISPWPDKEYKTISIDLNPPGNVYVYIRCGDLKRPREHDNLIALFNSDVNGVLSRSWLEDLKHLLNFDY